MVKKSPVLRQMKEKFKKTIQQMMLKELLQWIWARKNNRRYLILLMQLLQTPLPLLMMHILVVQWKGRMNVMQMVSYVYLGWTQRFLVVVEQH